MKLTNGEIFGVTQPINALMGQKFPIKTSFALWKLAQALNDALKPVNELRNSLVQKYGAKEKDNIVVKRDSPNWAAFQSEYEELMAIEVEVALDPVPLPESAELSPVDLVALEKLVVML